MNKLLTPYPIRFIAIALISICFFAASMSHAGEARISGLVKDHLGPINNGKIEVTDSKGKTVVITELKNSNRYTVTVPSGTSYPIILTGSAKCAGPVKAVVMSDLADRIDISDVSTMVVDNAMKMGGLTETNIAKASGSALAMRQKEGVSAGAGGSTGGPGNSGGGVARGGHGGHDMSGGEHGGQQAVEAEPEVCR